MEEPSKFHTVRGYQRLEKQDKVLTSAMEDYLEMIYRNGSADGYIRVNTLSELLNVAAPSVTKMVQNLSRSGLVVYRRYEFITLTEKGREIGKYLLLRHTAVETLLKNLGVKEEVLTDTERIEHDISDATLFKINTFNQFLEQNPEILKSYEDYAEKNMG